MEQHNIDTAMSVLLGKLPAENMPEIEQLLLTADDEKLDQIISFPLRSSVAMMLAAIFGGVIGLDRFLLGKNTQGIIKLLTFGGCCFWVWVNVFTVMGESRRYNYEKIKEILDSEQTTDPAD